MLVVAGRVAGISGILGRALERETGDRAWRLAFLLTLPLGAWLWRWFSSEPLAMELHAPGWAVVAGGLLVGFGTQLGNGCTSGHGVCGISRGSGRSIVATLVFMAAGAATVAVVRHGLGG
jgi:uncharacterized membrane protein YedE/YeeE